MSTEWTQVLCCIFVRCCRSVINWDVHTHTHSSLTTSKYSKSYVQGSISMMANWIYKLVIIMRQSLAGGWVLSLTIHSSREKRQESVCFPLCCGCWCASSTTSRRVKYRSRGWRRSIFFDSLQKCSSDCSLELTWSLKTKFAVRAHTTTLCQNFVYSRIHTLNLWKDEVRFTVFSGVSSADLNGQHPTGGGSTSAGPLP